LNKSNRKRAKGTGVLGERKVTNQFCQDARSTQGRDFLNLKVKVSFYENHKARRLRKRRGEKRTEPTQGLEP